MIFVLRRVTRNRRLLRKKTYNAPHKRHRKTTYSRENKNLVKSHQEEFKGRNGPNIRRKKRPKREVEKGFKMSYRYKYYHEEIVEDDEELVEETEDDKD